MSNVPPGGWSQPVGGQLPQAVPDYLVWSILVTLFCCLPTGIAAIVFAAQANTLATSGQYAAALAKARQAKTWTWVSFGLGLVVPVLYVLFFVFVTVLSIGGSSTS